MSTLTKINGVLNNNNLPIITERGLENYYYGKFVNNLAEQSYVMTEVQDTAVKKFFSNLTDNGVSDYIQTMFPFIGTNDNANAAKVAMFADVLFDFSNSFDGLVYEQENIVGISKTPAISTLKLSNVQPSGTFAGAAFSFNKSATDSDTYNDKLLNFYDKYQIRLQNNIMRLYARQSNGNYTVMGGGRMLDNFKNAGSVYMAYIQDNAKNTPSFLRYQEKDGIIERVSDMGGSNVELSVGDSTSTLSSTSAYSVVDTLTSVVFFKKMIPTDKFILFTTEWKTLLSALGKTY